MTGWTLIIWCRKTYRLDKNNFCESLTVGRTNIGVAMSFKNMLRLITVNAFQDHSRVRRPACENVAS